MKTDLVQSLTTYVGASSMLAVSGEGLLFLAERYGLVRQADYLAPVVGAFSIPALYLGLQLTARGMRLSQPPVRAGPKYPAATSTLSSVAAWFVGQPKPINHSWGLSDTGQPMRILNLPKEPARVEFIFYEAGMLSQISESRLYDFCKIAWRRQQNVYSGNLAANRIFSREYFTKNARPRWPKADYISTIHILDSRELIVNRWKGGELKFPPGISVEEARRRWATYTN